MIRLRDLLLLWALVIVVETAVCTLLAYEGAWTAPIAIIPSTAAPSFAIGLAFGRKVNA